MTTLRRVLQQSADLAPPTPAIEEPPAAAAVAPVVVAEEAVAATVLAAVTWVQCDTCQKWRKLPPNMEDALGEVWTCNMNKWAPNGGSCEDPEDAEDPIAVLPVLFDAPALLVAPEPVVAPLLPPAPPPPVREKKPAAPPPPLLPLAPLLPPGINLYGQAFQLPPIGKQARIVSYRDLIASHYRNNKTFNPHYDHICDMRYAAFSCYTSPTVHLEPAFPQSQPPVLFPATGSRLPPKKRHKLKDLE